MLPRAQGTQVDRFVSTAPARSDRSDLEWEIDKKGQARQAQQGQGDKRDKHKKAEEKESICSKGNNHNDRTMERIHSVMRVCMEMHFFEPRRESSPPSPLPKWDTLSLLLVTSDGRRSPHALTP